MKIVDELYTIPHDGNWILYAPLKGAVALVTPSVVEWLEAHVDIQIESLPDGLTPLKTIGVIEDQPTSTETLTTPYFRQPYLPTGVIILTTSFCNFRCQYCYASAANKRQIIDAEFAQAAIRLIANNAVQANVDEIHIAFHGGGEPTTAFPFMQTCVAYGEAVAVHHGLRLTASVVTNGYLNAQQIAWLGRKMHSIQVSLDGPADVQNLQRPLSNGGPTFERVVSTIHQLVALGIPDVLIKATISQKIVRRMPAIAKFLCEEFRHEIDRFHFGPVLEFGRSKETGFLQPIVDDFLVYATQAQSVAKAYGKSIVISGAQETFPNIRREFCGLTEPNFAITVDGQVSGCYEILTRDDPRSNRFHFGYFQDGSICMDDEKVMWLQERQAALPEKCSGCFARWQCAGDCQIRWYDEETGAFDDTADQRCLINRGLIKQKLIELVEAGGSMDIPIQRVDDVEGFL